MFGFARALLRWVRKRRVAYSPLVEVRISRDALVHNLKTFQALGDVAVAPVLKANAYGHGLAEVARVLDDKKLPFLCVDSFFEALMLRNEGIRTPILIIGYTPVENITGNALRRISFGVVGIEELRALSKSTRSPLAVHLEIDTGMHRHGLNPSEIEEAIALIGANPLIAPEGVYTHLADADTRDSSLTKAQIEAWNAAAKRFREAFPRIRYFHCAATAGSAHAKSIDANVMRLGIGLYGINEGFADVRLEPALEMRTRISSLRTVQKGGTIGYNATFKAEKEMQVATVPVGYSEGVDRRLSNKGFVLVRNTPCPILGRVSMNITSFDVSHVPGVHIGEEVVVLSADESAPNSTEHIARECGTIPYEILVHIPSRLRRAVV